ncbi:MAG: hypothetical protein EA398_09970 [Deltaproteobacteria bacterium]|nr:MAG: hypothetical protein EA398_09970 [Deltaproteobacteria bacterium]
MPNAAIVPGATAAIALLALVAIPASPLGPFATIATLLTAAAGALLVLGSRRRQPPERRKLELLERLSIGPQAEVVLLRCGDSVHCVVLGSGATLLPADRTGDSPETRIPATPGLPTDSGCRGAHRTTRRTQDRLTATTPEAHRSFRLEDNAPEGP